MLEPTPVSPSSNISSGKGHTIVIRFLRGFTAFVLGGTRSSPPPKLRARFRPLVISFRNGDGCAGTFSRRVGVPGGNIGRGRLDWRGERLVLVGDDISFEGEGEGGGGGGTDGKSRNSETKFVLIVDDYVSVITLRAPIINQDSKIGGHESRYRDPYPLTRLISQLGSELRKQFKNQPLGSNSYSI